MDPVLRDWDAVGSTIHSCRKIMKPISTYLIFYFLLFINELAVCIILGKEAAANTGLPSGEAHRRRRDSNPRPLRLLKYT